jgi:hypothetical protein
MIDLPIACTLTAAELQSRGSQLLPGLIARATSRTSVPEGLHWSFVSGDGILAEIARVIDAERRCCPFLRFTVVVEAGGGAVTLAVTGPAGTKAFLEQLC